MRIRSMTATFGKLENQTLELKPGLNIIHAPNEWGKSTWCAFLAIMLYGLETREKTTKTSLAAKERYAPWSGSPMSGRIDLNWNGRDITIERWSKGRTPLGEFRAYETGSGIAVEELTGANCGQMLLGVERGVFLRASYLRLNDLPVTEDEALRRRLNALVTTGDESGTSDLLAQKLKDLKNKCRSNRANGLIPQAEMEKAELENKLSELQSLQAQSNTLSQRQQMLTEQILLLENHQKTLAYAAGEENHRRIALAQFKQEQAERQLEEWKAKCADLPDQQQARESAGQLHQLHQDSMALDLEQQMLPPAPQPPKDTNSCVTLEQVQADTQQLQALFALRNPLGKSSLLAVSLIGASILVAFTVYRVWGKLWLAALFPGMALVLSIALLLVSRKRKTEISNHLQRLEDVYGSLDAADWLRQAQTQAAYTAELAKHEQLLAAFRAKRETLAARIGQLTQGKSIGECLQHWENVARKWDNLADARQAYENATAHAEAMAAMAKPVEKPTMPDDLRYSEAETQRMLDENRRELQRLQQRQGQCQGKMESLGAQSALQARLEAINARLDRLGTTYRALELALRTLETATAELQRRFAPRIAERAQELFSRLTGGRYDRLTLQQDLSVNAAAQGETVLHAAQWRSEGTIDQLYFALRLAVAKELTPEAPLILDDALVRFDDTRHAAAMGILRQEAEEKQIIFFTCQGREQ